jgi:hypothetical protein
MPWYIYTPSHRSSPTNPNNWTLVGTVPPFSPGPHNFLSAIQANDNLGQPIITRALRGEIAQALQNRRGTTNVLLSNSKRC